MALYRGLGGAGTEALLTDVTEQANLAVEAKDAAISAKDLAVAARNAVQDAAADAAIIVTLESEINTLSDLETELNALYAIRSDISAVEDISANVTTVAAISSDVTTVAGDTTNINTIVTDLNGTDTIGTVATNIANVNTVAGIDSNVTTVATNNANVTTVATNIANVNTTATNIANINTVVTNIANVNTVAGVTTDLSNVTANLTDIQNADTNAVAAQAALDSFNSVYRGESATAPTTSLVTGQIYFNSTNDTLYVYDGSAWNQAAFDVNGALFSGDNVSLLTNDAGYFTSSDVGTTANKLVQLDGTAKLPAVDGSQLTGISSEGPETTNRGYWTVDTAKTNQFLGKYTSVRVMPSDVTIGGTWEALPSAEIYVLESTTLDSFDEYFEEDTTIASGTTHTFYQTLNVREGVTVTVNGTLEGFGATPTGSASGSVTLTQVQAEIDGSFVFEAFGESA